MHQSLDRRQPSTRFRAQLREIPLQRTYGTGATARQLPPRAGDEGRTDGPLSGGGHLVRVGSAPDATAGQDMQAEIAATTGPEVLEEHGADLVDQGLTGADLPGDVDPPAAPADQPLEGVREPEEADDLIRQVQEGRPVDPCVPEVPGGGVQPVIARGRDLVRNLASPAARSATTGTGGAGRVVSDRRGSGWRRCCRRPRRGVGVAGGGITGRWWRRSPGSTGPARPGASCPRG